MVKVIFLFLVVSLFTGTLSAQESDAQKVDFYMNLAFRDAEVEQQMGKANQEDEDDFWEDQWRFESTLQKKDPNGYQSYINAKRIAYERHQIACGENCDYSQRYYEQAARYINEGTMVFAQGIQLSADTDQKPQLVTKTTGPH